MRKWMMLVLIVVLSSLLPGTATAEFQKIKVAVLDFQLQGKGYDTADMGKIVAEWLITALVKEGRFEVVERRLLEQIFQEHKLIMTGAVDAQSATQLGKLLGVKVIISGSVLKLRDFTEVNARIIDVESASIITAERVKSRTTERLEELVVQMAEKIIKDFPLQGYIVNKNKQRVVIDVGKRAGVKRGMHFIVYKEGEVIRHPKTGEILDVRTIETGLLEIDKVKNKISEGTIIKEYKPEVVEYGQMVKSVPETAPPVVASRPPKKTTPVRKPKPKTVKKPAKPVIPKKVETTKQPKKALSDVEMKLSKVDPILAEIRRLKDIGNVQWEIKYKEAMRRLEPIYAQYPYSAVVFYYYAKTYAEIDEIRRANKALEKALYYDPQYKEALMLKGDINYSYGEKIQPSGFFGKRNRNKLGILARDAYESVVGIEQDMSSKAMIYYKMGNVYAELLEDQGKGKEYWQKATSTAPDSEAARLAWQKLKE
jgi:TolB-like protein